MADNQRMYVQYGAGYDAPANWLNFDSSPTLRVQKIPAVGPLLAKAKNNSQFPGATRFGDIIKGLPLAPASVDGLYASHVLEHLALNEMRQALRNSLLILKPGGIFRLIVPDLLGRAKRYVEQAEAGNPEASHQFMTSTYLGCANRRRGVPAMLFNALGNADHQWMWDVHSMTAELHNAGFTAIREAKLGDSGDPMFDQVEREDRFFDEGFKEVAMHAERPPIA